MTDVANSRLVLASTSPYRRALLFRVGLTFSVAAPLYEEVPLGLAPKETACERACAKARSLAAHFPNALIIGSDQVLAFQGELIGKPATPEAARAQLLRLQGHTHHLYTAVAVLKAESGELRYALNDHELRMRALNPEEIARYVERDDPVGCAGAYKLESLGIALFEEIKGGDDSAVVGLPLIETLALLRAFGVDPLG